MSCRRNPTCKYCCDDDLSCDIASDDFNRADSTSVGSQWYKISGDWEIDDNMLSDGGTSGILATAICHPSSYIHASWTATFNLRKVRTVSLFEIGVGDPSSSTYGVKFEPMNIDTTGAVIRITLVGDETKHQDYSWPSDVHGSSDTVEVQVCYKPSVYLTAKVRSEPEPPDSVCVSDPPVTCYSVSCQDIGGFFFVEGWFDDWLYQATDIDNHECPSCTCHCQNYDDDASCFPDDIVVSFIGEESSIEGCFPPDFEIELTRSIPGPMEWGWTTVYLPCGGGEGIPFDVRAHCMKPIDDGLDIWQTMLLEIRHSYPLPHQFLFWTNLGPFDDLSGKYPERAESVCRPLSMVYRYLTIAFVLSSGGYDHWSSPCCSTISTVKPTFLWRVVVTRA